jgi:hypothetical protein
VACTEAVSLVALADEGLSSKGLAAKTALVLGKRSDGKPGIWVVNPGKKIETVISEETGKLSSCLPESDEKGGCFRGKFGWSYTIMGASEDGKIIIGYAKTEKGFSWHGQSVDPGTTVGVYWRVSKYRDGKHHMVSRARIIGIFDPSALTAQDKKHRHWYGWLQRPSLEHLKWFLLDSLTSYLIMVEKDGVSYDKALQLYLVRGTDQDDRPAIASIGERGVVAIEPVASEELSDLRPGVMSFTGSGVADGANLEVSLEVENLESGAVSASFQVHFYLAATSTFSPSTDTDLGVVTWSGGVPGGSSVTVNASLGIPDDLNVNEARYVYAVVDATGLIAESDEANNQSTADSAAVVLVYDDENLSRSYDLVVETYAPTGSGSTDTMMALYQDVAGTTAKYLDESNTAGPAGYAALNGGAAVTLDPGKYYVVVLSWAPVNGPYALGVRTANIDPRQYANLASNAVDTGEPDETPTVWPITGDTSLPSVPVSLQAGNSANRYSAALDYDWFTFILP